MPLKDQRVKATAKLGKLATAGRMNVTYFDALGRSRVALVLGPGTASGLKLSVGSTNQIIDNVPKATTGTSTSCYTARI